MLTKIMKWEINKEIINKGKKVCKKLEIQFCTYYSKYTGEVVIWVSLRFSDITNSNKWYHLNIRSGYITNWNKWYHYNELVISPIRYSDITNSNKWYHFYISFKWYHHLEFVIRIVISLDRICDITNLN